MMNDLLIEKLQLLANDKSTLQALRWIFQNRVDKEKPIISDTNDNALIGEKYRAYEMSKTIIDKVLREIETYNNLKVSRKNFNKER